MLNILIPRKYKMGCTGNIISEKTDTEKVYMKYKQKK